MCSSFRVQSYFEYSGSNLLESVCRGHGLGAMGAAASLDWVEQTTGLDAKVGGWFISFAFIFIMQSIVDLVFMCFFLCHQQSWASMRKREGSHYAELLDTVYEEVKALMQDLHADRFSSCRMTDTSVDWQT